MCELSLNIGKFDRSCLRWSYFLESKFVQRPSATASKFFHTPHSRNEQIQCTMTMTVKPGTTIYFYFFTGPICDPLTKKCFSSRCERHHRLPLQHNERYFHLLYRVVSKMAVLRYLPSNLGYLQPEMEILPDLSM